MRLDFKAKFNPKLKEPIIIDEEENARPYGSKKKSAKKVERKTLAANKTTQKKSKRVTRSMAGQDKLSMLAQAAEKMED